MLRMAVGEMFIHQSPLVAFDEFYTNTKQGAEKNVRIQTCDPVKCTPPARPEAATIGSFHCNFGQPRQFVLILIYSLEYVLELRRRYPCWLSPAQRGLNVA